MMHAAKTTTDDLRDAHEAADVLISAPYRKYLFTSGRLLPVLVARFRDDLAEALGMELPEIPRRNGQVQAARLDHLTSSEFSVIWGAVDALIETSHYPTGSGSRPARRELQGERCLMRH